VTDFGARLANGYCAANEKEQQAGAAVDVTPPSPVGRRNCLPKRTFVAISSTGVTNMSQVTTDHQTIRGWAERHGGKPAAVARTHEKGDVGIIRIMFPKAPRSEHEGLTEISWDEFFKEFDERSLALVYEDGGLFSKVVSRDSEH
jgi:hypothetical protein